MKKRRVVAIFFPQLGIECFEKERHKRLQETALLYREESTKPYRINETQRIDAISEDLYLYGIYPSMTIRDARRCLPSMEVKAFPRDRIRQAMSALAELCVTVSPAVAVEENMIFVDITNRPLPTHRLLNQLTMLFRDSGHRRVLAATSKKRWSGAWVREVFLQRVMQGKARGKIPASWILKREPSPQEILEMSLLALPILPLQREELHSLGIRCLGDLKKLDADDLSTCLYESTQNILHFMKQDSDAPVQVLHSPKPMVERAEFDFELTSLDPLRFALKPICQRLMGRLKNEERALVSLSLLMSVELGWSSKDAAASWKRGRKTVEAQLEFPSPLIDAAGLLRAVMGRLEHMDIDGRVEEIELEAIGTEKREGTQSAFPWRDDGIENRTVMRSLSSLMAELQADPKNQVGCLVHVGEILPEEMTTLDRPKWPSAKKPLRQARQGSFASGRFMEKWPWPTHILTAPRLAQGLAISRRFPFCVLEGITYYNQPFLREYAMVILEDGRCALGFSDPEADEFWIQGWFN